MIIPRLALRNLLGARIRTWLNVAVLSLSFVAIIIFQGIFRGLDEQGSKFKIESEYGGGQYWQQDYDAFDPLTLQDAHDKVPQALERLIQGGQAAAILVVQGTLYPNGRVMPVLIKGIDPGQKILTLPSSFLTLNSANVPALIGSRMAKSSGLRIGDTITLRWRETGGSFNALDLEITQVMNTTNPGIDNGQVWLPLEKLRSMTRMEGEANLVVLAKGVNEFPRIPGWTYKGLDTLLKDLKSMVQAKTVGGNILYTFLLLLAMLAIFDTQVLSIFKRRKEIGTLMALGMTRGAVVRLFTLEGALHGVLAALAGAAYGMPLAVFLMKKGWAMPQGTDSYGFALGNNLFPAYSAGLVIGTTVLVLTVTTIVSYLPTRKISKLKPTDALRGRIS